MDNDDFEEISIITENDFEELCALQEQKELS